MSTLTLKLHSELKELLGEQIYHTWISPTSFRNSREGILTWEVPNKFFRDWLEGHYLSLIKEASSKVTGQSLQVDFDIRPLPENAVKVPPEPEVKSELPKAGSVYGTELNPKYTFERFIVGQCNRFAHAASLAVSQDPGKAYNPLFLYGGVGLGKTHLMQATAQTILNNNPRARILYLSSETFTNDFINSIANKSTDKFRRKYRSLDALLIDDIHFLRGKAGTQEQFFHTFNVLWDARKQIILSSDRPPKEIPDIAERLISRFEWGLVVDLLAPDRETRIAILRREAEWAGVDIPEEVIIHIADRIKSNIRKLEGALIRVASYSSLTHAPLSVQTAELALNGIAEDEVERFISIDEIQRKIAEFYDIRVADMKSSRRPKTIAFPRQIAMYLSRVMTDSSLNEIGESFGGRDHTTVMHACRLIEDRSDSDKHLSNILSHLRKLISSQPIPARG
jgi:chromosomal replication initiator protein